MTECKWSHSLFINKKHWVIIFTTSRNPHRILLDIPDDNLMIFTHDDPLCLITICITISFFPHPRPSLPFLLLFKRSVWFYQWVIYMYMRRLDDRPLQTIRGGVWRERLQSSKTLLSSVRTSPSFLEAQETGLLRIISRTRRAPGLILHGGNGVDCLRAPCWSLPLCTLKCSSRNLQFPRRVPLIKTAEKVLCANALSKTKHN